MSETLAVEVFFLFSKVNTYLINHVEWLIPTGRAFHSETYHVLNGRLQWYTGDGLNCEAPLSSIPQSF